MSGFEGYLEVVALCSPLLFFVMAVAFRLLDNSASIFLKHDILVTSSYVSGEVIKKCIDDTEDQKLKKMLGKALMFRRLHNFFMILVLVSIPPVVIAYFLAF
ncbi:hypothetical protein ACFSTE_07045 [Aquimarina hainanensis]|uniref:Uncharacterized protein n=1 Tax=Aquimarina hainanensis TaxID=1578017 RepID=A0ABW5N4M4_9FLAO|nr:hypothetical protein [Aquimarina sp. TRL1]QKX05002.1 hypothetical protein HN014_08755 [Aquimarina sp. TRL1]